VKKLPDGELRKENISRGGKRRGASVISARKQGGHQEKKTTRKSGGEKKTKPREKKKKNKKRSLIRETSRRARGGCPEALFSFKGGGVGRKGEGGRAHKKGVPL